MPIAVCAGAKLQCSMGTVPAPLGVLPNDRILVQGRPMASIMDNKPGVNIMTFGMCQVPKPPIACSPATGALPWSPGDFTLPVAGEPALTNFSVCPCSVGGVIFILDPGCTTVNTV